MKLLTYFKCLKKLTNDVSKGILAVMRYYQNCEHNKIFRAFNIKLKSLFKLLKGLAFKLNVIATLNPLSLTLLSC